MTNRFDRSQDGPVLVRRSWALLTVLLVVTAPARSGEPAIELNARTLYERSVTSDLRLAADGNSILLAWGELFEDDGPAAGYSYRPNTEDLSTGVWVKKEFVIPNPQARSAYLIALPQGRANVLINGKAVVLEGGQKTGKYGRLWRFDPSALKKGRNEIVIHGSGKLWIARDDEYAAGSRTRTSHPNRSAKSTDGGKTWDYDHLGTGGDVDGEYYVRLFLEQMRGRGELTSPVVDLGNPRGNPVAPGVGSIGPIRIAIHADRSQAGTIHLKARSGKTYVPDGEWSAWADVRAGKPYTPAGRFLQFRLVFRTTSPTEAGPTVKGIRIDSASAVEADWTGRLTVRESHNERIVRTSIPFEYEPSGHPELQTLRRKYKLDEVVAGAESEFQAAVRLAAWTSRQWKKGHLGESYPPWDALEILKPHADGTAVGGFCQQYNTVFVQACLSLGIVARNVSIGPGSRMALIRGGHEVAEVWSNEHRKWVYMDGHCGWYLVDAKSKTPLSILELHQRQVEAVLGGRAAQVDVVPFAQTRFKWKGLKSWPPFLEVRLIPRNNYLSRRSPLPLNQGMRGWMWTGHYVWAGGDVPARRIYDNRIIKRGNFEWTLNQAQYLLEATKTPGLLRVHLDTETPNFETFLARIDTQAPRPVKPVFDWQLHEGENRLAVWPRNTAGRDGIKSWVVLDYK